MAGYDDLAACQQQLPEAGLAPFRDVESGIEIFALHTTKGGLRTGGKARSPPSLEDDLAKR
jgi:hypothetical protein